MNVVAIDSETDLIRPGVLAPRLVCISLSWEPGQAELVHAAEARPWVAGLLASDKLLVGHNIAYDMAVFAKAWPELLPAIFDKYERDQISDTMIRQKLAHIGMGQYRGKGTGLRFGYSLAACLKQNLGYSIKGKDTPDAWRFKYIKLVDTPIAWWPEKAKAYALDDARLTRVLYFDQQDGQMYYADEYNQARAAFWLHLMSCRGLKTDPEGVNAFERELVQDHLHTSKLLEREGLLRSNGTRDTKRAQSRLRERLGDSTPLTPIGKPKLDRETCESTKDEVLIAYANYSSLNKQLTTDIPLLKRGQFYPIQPRFEVLLETGRTSSRPNVQNLPRGTKMRECFVPRPGYIYAGCDYGQFELRTVAQVCTTWFERSYLGEALNAGRDPHLGVAAFIKGIEYEEAVERKKEPEIKNLRQVGKVANFGFPGGLGYKRLVHFAKATYGVDMTEGEAKTLKTQWLKLWPEFAAYFRKISTLTERQARIQQIFSDRLRAGISYCEACNTMFQGLASDAAKRAGWLITRACYVEENSPLFGSYPVNFVHDEFILEVPEDRAHEAASELARLMKLGADEFLPDVPSEAEPYLMRRWLKNAEPVYRNGRLVPWKP